MNVTMGKESIKSLTQSIINERIDEILKQNQKQHFQSSQRLELDRVSDWTTVLDEGENIEFPLYFGVIAKFVDQNQKSKNEEDSKLISFYIGYSTWDGRCLCVDQLPKQEKYQNVEKLLMQLLAKIAVSLSCNRLIWMRTDTPPWYATCTDNSPEVLQKWLVLRMDKSSMERYTGMNRGSTTYCSSFNKVFVYHKVMDCLKSSKRLLASKFRLRLASMDNSEDAKNIARLVQGLAIYEKEPDAVNCTLDDYILDGGGKEPLFYCLLLDYYEKDSADASRHTCGMAFMYFGYVLSQGRFLYLEDLFLEEAYRKQGGGTLILQTLAEIGLHLDCSQFYWTALDWNSPALNLYEKVGAKIQKGLQISRYTGTSLRTFAESSII